MLNSYQQLLFDNLENLVLNNKAFYRQEFELDESIYWIYNYRLASYADFLAPDALECRGVMFEMNMATKEPIRLASLPMQKFFNLNENPSTMNLDLSKVKEIQVKADGSLMSTYLHNGQLRLKSKGSLFSEHALSAMKWLDTQDMLKETLNALTVAGYTVNLEWCSPEHRIVLGYMTPHLKVLNARKRETGEYLPHSHLQSIFGIEQVIDSVYTEDPEAFIAAVPNIQDDIEGFVVTLEDGLRFKIKTNKYLSLHHAKDSVNNPRRLFEAILDEGVDDLRSMFYTDTVAIKMIDNMQKKVDHLYNNMVNLVENFYATNKHLDRKDYAIKGQQELDRMYFGLAMNRFLGKDPHYKTWMKRHYKDFGIKDIQTEE